MSTAQGFLKVPSVFGSGMVLQRQVPVRIWGWGRAGQTVQVTVGEVAVETKIDGEGRWCLQLPALQGGGPVRMSIRSGNEELSFTDVLIGEVWVCSGQSNMEWAVEQCAGQEMEIPAANWPKIRLFAVPKEMAESPQRDVNAAWKTCTPETVRSFSAVGYYFGRQLHQELEVPVGLIMAAWGGTTAEAWTPFAALQAEPALQYMAKQALPNVRTTPWPDPGNKGLEWGWGEPNADEKEWQTMVLPTAWERVGLAIDGAVWFRLSVDVPAGWAGKDLDLSLGVIDDFDVAYFNGAEVGRTGSDIPNWWVVRRRYPVPGNLVKAGRNVIAVRVFDQWGEGGIMGLPADMRLRPAGGSGEEAIDLSGEWKYRVELALEPALMAPMGPSLLYNAMIAPIAGYAARGAIWYQGESNMGRGDEYEILLKAMIGAWRKAWAQSRFDFHIVQLPNFGPVHEDIPPSPWAELRDAQRRVAETVEHCGLAVTIDQGDPNDIHPVEKRELSRRLGNVALAKTYGKAVHHSGPVVESAELRGAEVVLKFRSAEGLVARGGAPRGFAIAGADGRFRHAEARIEDSAVVVACKDIGQPRVLQYAWADSPACNLFDQAGLPARPFRVDLQGR